MYDNILYAWGLQATRRKFAGSEPSAGSYKSKYIAEPTGLVLLIIFSSKAGSLKYGG